MSEHNSMNPENLQAQEAYKKAQEAAQEAMTNLMSGVENASSGAIAELSNPGLYQNYSPTEVFALFQIIEASAGIGAKVMGAMRNAQAGQSGGQ